MEYILPPIVYRCPCCGREMRDARLYSKLDNILDASNGKLKVTSGYRCERHNKAVRGAENSTHLRGLGVDIACDDQYWRHELLGLLFWQGFPRIIIYPAHIHADIDETLPNPILFTDNY